MTQLLLLAWPSFAGYRSILLAILSQRPLHKRGASARGSENESLLQISKFEDYSLLPSLFLSASHCRDNGDTSSGGPPFGQLDYAQTMRLVVPRGNAALLGFQMILSTYLLECSGDDRKRSQTIDLYADDYDVALTRGTSVSGETKDYFVQRRIEWLRDCLIRLSAPVAASWISVAAQVRGSRFFFDILGVENFVGIDQSPKKFGGGENNLWFRTEPGFLLFDEYEPCDEVVDFVMGFFIIFRQWSAPPLWITSYDRCALGGYVALWENNPWNPGTRYVMSRIPFDRDAITLAPAEARQLLRRFGGFDKDVLVYLSKIHFRWVEPFCSRLPLGTQYQILCRKFS